MPGMLRPGMGLVTWQGLSESSLGGRQGDPTLQLIGEFRCGEALGAKTS